MGAFKSHITNIIDGVQNVHVYKLKVCSGHFPMSVSVSGEESELRFYGDLNNSVIQNAEMVIEEIFVEGTGTLSISGSRFDDPSSFYPLFNSLFEISSGNAAFDYCEIDGLIYAPSSSGNSITNSIIHGKFSGGLNWNVVDNEIISHVSHSNEYFPTPSTAISNLSGNVINNIISVSATNYSGGGSSAHGFHDCDVLAAHNIIGLSAEEEVVDRVARSPAIPAESTLKVPIVGPIR